MFDLSDLKYALRLLKKSPRFTLLTTFVLAGGLAISIYTYAVLNTMLYKDLPVPGGDSVVRILGQKDGRNKALNAFELSEIRADIRSLEGIGAYASSRSLFGDQDASRSIKTTHAEWNIFEFTRTKPLMGRGFVRQDNVDGAESVAVIGFKIWQSVFAGDPDIIDRVVRINGKPTRIVGVMPQGYAFPVSAEMWLPLSDRESNPTGYSQTALDAYARLRPGFSIREASTELSALLLRTQQQQQRPNAEKDKLDAAFASSFQLAQAGPEGSFVFAVLNVVSLFILLLACVNVGNMLLARTNERVKEIAVRVALGAPRIRLMAQMMLESVIICAVGGLLALLPAAWALNATNQFLSSTLEGDLPFWWRWRVDGDTLLMTGVFVALAILLVSALPTFSATNVNASALLRDGTRGARGRMTGRITRVLVTVEIVLISVIMLVGSAMAIVAYRAAHVDFGMDTTNLVTMPVELTGEAYDTPEEQLLFYQRLVAELRRSNDIEAAMVMQDLGESEFAIDGTEYNTASDYPKAAMVVASETPVQIGTRLIEGRNFDSRDSATGLKTVVVSESLAKTYWAGTSALGRRIRLVEAGNARETRVVVGVVSDIRRGDLLTTTKSNFAALYIPLPQAILASAGILAKHRGDDAAARNALYRAVGTIDAYVAPSRIMSYGAVLEQLTLMATTMTDLFVRCGIFAILLAMTGIYGLSSNAVVQRTNEIGLRRAVGATDGSIIGLFLRQGSRQLAVGLLASTLISAAVLYFIAKFTGVGAALLTFIGVFVALAVSALVLLAIYLSTRRAVHYEPCVALRHE